MFGHCQDLLTDPYFTLFYYFAYTDQRNRRIPIEPRSQNRNHLRCEFRNVYRLEVSRLCSETRPVFIECLSVCITSALRLVVHGKY